MSNIEFLRAPIFISATNMVTPITTITFDSLYTNALVFGNIVVNILQIFIETAGFIMKEGFTEAFANASALWTNLNFEKIVYIIGVYNLFMLLVLDNQRRKITEQNEHIESLEKQVDYLKKMERMREDLDELWIQDVKSYHQETSKKMTAMEKKIKKMEKEMKIYE